MPQALSGGGAVDGGDTGGNEDRCGGRADADGPP
jgi:hypothetical protein